MAKTLDWDRLRSVFAPDEVLVGPRAKAFYCEREHSPFERMCIDFRKTESPGRRAIAFFTGHRGSGKSSLLVRLFEHFKDAYFVVYFDVGHNLDRSKANQIDLLYLLGATVFQVGVQEKVKPDPKYLRSLAESVYTLTYESKKKAKEQSLNVAELARGLLCFGASMIGGRFAEKMADALLKPFTLSSGVSEEVARKREIEHRFRTSSTM